MINRFFIVSTGRTATLSLARTLDAVPALCATHEALPDAREISNRLWDGDVSRNQARWWIAQSLRRYDKLTSPAERIAAKRGWKRLRASLAHAVTGKYAHRATIDSNCLAWNFIDLLDDVCEGNVAFIYVRRDAEATVRSMFNSPFYRARGSVPWERRAQRGFIDITAQGYSEADRLRNCQYGYQIRTERIESALQRIDASRKLQIRFEELVARTDVLKEISAFLSRLSGAPATSSSRLLHLHQGPTCKRSA